MGADHGNFTDAAATAGNPMPVNVPMVEKCEEAGEYEQEEAPLGTESVLIPGTEFASNPSTGA